MNINPDLYRPTAPDRLAEGKAPANDPAPRESDQLLGAECRTLADLRESGFSGPLRDSIKHDRDQLLEQLQPSQAEKLVDCCIEMAKRLVTAENRLTALNLVVGTLDGRIAHLERNMRPPYVEGLPLTRSEEENLQRIMRELRGKMRLVAEPQTPYHDINSDTYVFPNGVKIAAVVLYQLGLWQTGDKPLSVSKSESGYVYLLANT